jgi:hypothetical protein
VVYFIVIIAPDYRVYLNGTDPCSNEEIDEIEFRLWSGSEDRYAPTFILTIIVVLTIG